MRLPEDLERLIRAAQAVVVAARDPDCWDGKQAGTLADEIDALDSRLADLGYRP